MKKVFTKRLISAILTTALIGTSAFALFGCGKASKILLMMLRYI